MRTVQFFRIALVAATALLSSCGGGSVATPGASTSTSTLQAVTVPAFAAVTVPVTNPAPGAPLVVNIPVIGGTATMTFPAGTTVDPGTSILVKTVALPPLVFTQSTVRRAASSSGPTDIPAAPTQGLYVQVLDGLIHVNNTGGSQAFTAGDFGYTAGFEQPPVLVPTNPGLQFTPPPSFVAVVGAGGVVGPAYPATTTASGNISMPIVFAGNAPTTVLIGAQSMFPVNVPFTSSGTSSAITGATATTLTLPLIEALIGGTVLLPPITKAEVDATFSMTPPAGVAVIASNKRGLASIGGSFAAAAYVTLAAQSTLAFGTTPAFAFSYAADYLFGVTGSTFYLAWIDPSQPANGWVPFARGVISGQTITFASSNLPLTMQANTPYQFALISTPQTLAVPTPLPTNTPSPAPTATPSPSPSPSPTPFVATLTTAAQIGSFNDFLVPPILPGLTASSAIFYSQTTTSATQGVTVTASTGNFASLAVPPGKTAVLFLTVSFASGANLAFDNTSPPFNLAGTLFAIGTTYTMTPTFAGVPLTSSSVVAAPDDHPGDSGGGLLDFTSGPLEGFTLLANQQVGIVISH